MRNFTMCQRQWLYSIFIVLTFTASLAQAQTNGGFSDDLDYWAPEGSVSIQTANPDVTPNKYAIFREPGSGGLSLIKQTLTFPSTSPPDKIQFKFGLFKDAQSRTSVIPPDSFTVFLINTANSTYL